MKLARTPLLYILLGFIGGVIITRNAAPMSAPSKGALVLAMLVGGFILWRAGYKGKAEAVATAVAIATATATAEAKAEATAQAQAAINLYMGASPDRVYEYDDDAPILSLQDSDEVREIDECTRQTQSKSLQKAVHGTKQSATAPDSTSSATLRSRRTQR